MRLRWAKPLATLPRASEPSGDHDEINIAALSAPDFDISGRMLPRTDRVARLLAQVRRRLRLRETVRSSLLWLAASLGSGTVLLSLAASTGPSVLWLPLLTAWVVATSSALAMALWRAHSHQRSDEDIARYVGARVPDLRSDLLSTVQLLQEPPGSTSRALVLELSRRTAAAAATLVPAELCSFRPVWQAAGIAGAVAVGVTLWAGLCGLPLHKGLRYLIQVPPPHPVQTSSEPLVGDIRLLLSYPKYTGLPQRTIPGSSGDVLALPGTQVRVEARALGRVEHAQLIVVSSSDGGSKERAQPVQIVRGDSRPGGGTQYPLLTASFTVQRAGLYYFIIERSPRDSVRESAGHRIDIETDHPPRIDLFAPAAELEVTGTRRIELAYSAEDDFGLGDIDLVYKIGATPERRKHLRTAARPDAAKPDGGRSGRGGATVAVAAAPRNIAAKIEWDLTELELSPGARVTYSMEARDLDNINGPNVGRSREYALKILSPREKSEALLHSQDQLRELAIQLLGDRLELARVLPAHGSELTSEQLERVLGVHRKTESFLLQIGRLQQDSARIEPAVAQVVPKDLQNILQEIGRRLGKLTQDEEAVLGELRKARGGQPGAKSRSGSPKEVPVLTDRHIGELERDVITLDDLLGRQRLEELLAISDEMSSLRDRMRQLLAEYKKAPSDAVRRELERELRSFERRMAELTEKARHLATELPDEFLNREAMGQNDLQSRIDRLRDLIQKGDIARAEQEMERMSQALDNLVKGMEQNLRGFRRERFTAEEKALGELENRLSDLAHDQEELKAQTESVKQNASARARQLLKDRAEQLSRRLQGDIARLRKLLGDVDVAPLGPWGGDEMDKTTKRLEDLERMLEQGDVDEAREMALQAEQSIGKLESEMRGEEQASRWGQRVRLGRSRARLEQARPIARDIASELEKALPRPEELLSPAERKQLAELRSQQEALRKRGGELGRDIQKRAQQTKDAPLLERLAQQAPELMRKAGGFMEQSAGELQRLQPRSAAAAQGQAVEQLSQMRQQMQQARRPQNEGAGMRSEREPIKIPGADEYRAPKEFRQDILDAAKREAPPEYREQVKRYYEELIQ
jgi:hypothetical protein